MSRYWSPGFFRMTDAQFAEFEAKCDAAIAEYRAAPPRPLTEDEKRQFEEWLET